MQSCVNMPAPEHGAAGLGELVNWVSEAVNQQAGDTDTFNQSFCAPALVGIMRLYFVTRAATLTSDLHPLPFLLLLAPSPSRLSH